MNVTEVLATVNFDDGKSVVFSVSPSGHAEVSAACTVGQPWVDKACEIVRQHGLRPHGTFRGPSGGIGWIEYRPRFSRVHCSQCGQTFGPRDSGYSHCQDHAGQTAIED